MGTMLDSYEKILHEKEIRALMESEYRKLEDERRKMEEERESERRKLEEERAAERKRLEENSMRTLLEQNWSRYRDGKTDDDRSSHHTRSTVPSPISGVVSPTVEKSIAGSAGFLVGGLADTLHVSTPIQSPSRVASFQDEFDANMQLVMSGNAPVPPSAREICSTSTQGEKNTSSQAGSTLRSSVRGSKSKAKKDKKDKKDKKGK